jgi:hypothetical protein
MFDLIALTLGVVAFHPQCEWEVVLNESYHDREHNRSFIVSSVRGKVDLEEAFGSCHTMRIDEEDFIGWLFICKFKNFSITVPGLEYVNEQAIEGVALAKTEGGTDIFIRLVCRGADGAQSLTK